MWKKLDEPIPVLASIVITVLVAFVFIQSVRITMMRMENETQAAVFQKGRVVNRGEKIELKQSSRSAEGVFETMQEER